MILYARLKLTKVVFKECSSSFFRERENMVSKQDNKQGELYPQMTATGFHFLGGFGFKIQLGIPVPINIIKYSNSPFLFVVLYAYVCCLLVIHRRYFLLNT